MDLYVAYLSRAGNGAFKPYSMHEDVSNIGLSLADEEISIDAESVNNERNWQLLGDEVLHSTSEMLGLFG